MRNSQTQQPPSLAYLQWRDYIKSELNSSNDLESGDYIKKMSPHCSPINIIPPTTVVGGVRELLIKNSK
jgi:hypothetical protein